MQQLTDAILYVPDFAALVAHLDAEHPELLQRDEQGNVTQPPVVTGFARTPAAVNGNSLLVYARLREDEVAEWDGMPGVEVLARAPFTGPGTGQSVYDQVFADADLAAKYDGVYSRASYEVDDGEGGTTTVTPPAMFGLLAGA